MGLRRLIEKKIIESRLNPIQKELKRIMNLQRFTLGIAHLFDKPFKFHDSASFVDTYNEIFVNEIYKFKPSKGKRIIIDCGANMGLSVLYLAKQYPDHTVLAFEPDRDIFAVLEENVKQFRLENVQLFNKAVWDKVGVLSFYTDHGMGGRLLSSYEDQTPKQIETVKLADYLNPDVDFLKIDIEGAEHEVLLDCKDKLPEVGSLFFEYHNDINKPQTLHELLQVVKDAGFHYYVKESGVRQSPFTDTALICENFDMAINVFGYKEAR